MLNSWQVEGADYGPFAVKALRGDGKGNALLATRDGENGLAVYLLNGSGGDEKAVISRFSAQGGYSCHAGRYGVQSVIEKPYVGRIADKTTSGFGIRG